ncbi:hypothetical protein [Lysobacter sp. Root983]|uniref:hypothetical protein n=1 Tax=Lysobacter sp. Root983 TaxID=1736613 RepID=UPI00070A6F5E|nr:hypothetical protein [Lysobacter sp. Root983]KRD73584.1 hypothetical protein ASE43_18435 [Lysobacter sp. Root983]
MTSTTRQRLTQTARIGLAIKVAVMMPALTACLVVFFGKPGGESAFVAWCFDYWWAALLSGVFALVVIELVVVLFIRCPHCKFRLARAHGPSWAFFVLNAHIRYCAHCGRSLDEAKTTAVR